LGKTECLPHKIARGLMCFCHADLREGTDRVGRGRLIFTREANRTRRRAFAHRVRQGRVRRVEDECVGWQVWRGESYEGPGSGIN